MPSVSSELARGAVVRCGIAGGVVGTSVAAPNPTRNVGAEALGDGVEAGEEDAPLNCCHDWARLPPDAKEVAGALTWTGGGGGGAAGFGVATGFGAGGGSFGRVIAMFVPFGFGDTNTGIFDANRRNHYISLRLLTYG